jgi:ubiquinone/menaquinone biosynthesis C-methylase UbiE
MREPDVPQPESRQAAAVRELFALEAPAWMEVYQARDLRSLLFQQRLSRVEALAEELDIGHGSRCLDAGCGAGQLTVALARRYGRVEAFDVVPEMAELTRRQAEEAGVDDQVGVSECDVHRLCFAGGSFGLAVAIGVLPWAASPDQAAAELFRVLKPGGYLIVTESNRLRLTHLLDPFRNPLLARPKQAVKRMLSRSRGGRTPVTDDRYRWMTPRFPRQSRALLEAAGFEVVRSFTLGFGPFTLAHRPILPTRAGLALNRSLQKVGERSGRRRNVIGSLGNEFVAIARKPHPV